MPVLVRPRSPQRSDGDPEVAPLGLTALNGLDLVLPVSDSLFRDGFEVAVLPPAGVSWRVVGAFGGAGAADAGACAGARSALLPPSGAYLGAVLIGGSSSSSSTGALGVRYSVGGAAAAPPSVGGLSALAATTAFTAPFVLAACGVSTVQATWRRAPLPGGAQPQLSVAVGTYSVSVNTDGLVRCLSARPLAGGGAASSSGSPPAALRLFRGARDVDGNVQLRVRYADAAPAGGPMREFRLVAVDLDTWAPTGVFNASVTLANGFLTLLSIPAAALPVDDAGPLGVQLLGREAPPLGGGDGDPGSGWAGNATDGAASPLPPTWVPLGPPVVVPSGRVAQTPDPLFHPEPALVASLMAPDGSLSVTVSAAGDATIFVTTDGTNPRTAPSPLWASTAAALRLSLPGCVTVTAYAVAPRFLPSAVQRRTYCLPPAPSGAGEGDGGPCALGRGLLMCVPECSATYLLCSLANASSPLRVAPAGLLCRAGQLTGDSSVCPLSRCYEPSAGGGGMAPCRGPQALPSPSPSSSASASPSPSQTASTSGTPSPTASPSLGASPSASMTCSGSSSLSPPPSRSPSASPTGSMTPTMTRTSSATPSRSGPPSVSPSGSTSGSASPSGSSSRSFSPSPSVSASGSFVPAQPSPSATSSWIDDGSGGLSVLRGMVRAAPVRRRVALGGAPTASGGGGNGTTAAATVATRPNATASPASSGAVTTGSVVARTVSPTRTASSVSPSTSWPGASRSSDASSTRASSPSLLAAASSSPHPTASETASVSPSSAPLLAFPCLTLDDGLFCAPDAAEQANRSASALAGLRVSPCFQHVVRCQAGVHLEHASTPPGTLCYRGQLTHELDPACTLGDAYREPPVPPESACATLPAPGSGIVCSTAAPAAGGFGRPCTANFTLCVNGVATHQRVPDGLACLRGALVSSDDAQCMLPTQLCDARAQRMVCFHGGSQPAGACSRQFYMCAGGKPGELRDAPDGALCFNGSLVGSDAAECDEHRADRRPIMAVLRAQLLVAGVTGAEAGSPPVAAWLRLAIARSLGVPVDDVSASASADPARPPTSTGAGAAPPTPPPARLLLSGHLDTPGPLRSRRPGRVSGPDTTSSSSFATAVALMPGVRVATSAEVAFILASSTALVSIAVALRGWDANATVASEALTRALTPDTSTGIAPLSSMLLAPGREGVLQLVGSPAWSPVTPDGGSAQPASRGGLGAPLISAIIASAVIGGLMIAVLGAVAGIVAVTRKRQRQEAALHASKGGLHNKTRRGGGGGGGGGGSESTATINRGGRGGNGRDGGVTLAIGSSSGSGSGSGRRLAAAPSMLPRSAIRPPTSSGAVDLPLDIYDPQCLGEHCRGVSGTSSGGGGGGGGGGSGGGDRKKRNKSVTFHVSPQSSSVAASAHAAAAGAAGMDAASPAARSSSAPADGSSGGLPRGWVQPPLRRALLAAAAPVSALRDGALACCHQALPSGAPGEPASNPLSGCSSAEALAQRFEGQAACDAEVARGRAAAAPSRRAAVTNPLCPLRPPSVDVDVGCFERPVIIPHAVTAPAHARASSSPAAASASLRASRSGDCGRRGSVQPSRCPSPSHRSGTSPASPRHHASSASPRVLMTPSSEHHLLRSPAATSATTAAGAGAVSGFRPLSLTVVAAAAAAHHCCDTIDSASFGGGSSPRDSEEEAASVRATSPDEERGEEGACEEREWGGDALGHDGRDGGEGGQPSPPPAQAGGGGAPGGGLHPRHSLPCAHRRGSGSAERDRAFHGHPAPTGGEPGLASSSLTGAAAALHSRHDSGYSAVGEPATPRSIQRPSFAPDAAATIRWPAGLLVGGGLASAAELAAGGREGPSSSSCGVAVISPFSHAFGRGARRSRVEAALPRARSSCGHDRCGAATSPPSSPPDNYPRVSAPAAAAVAAAAAAAAATAPPAVGGTQRAPPLLLPGILKRCSPPPLAACGMDATDVLSRSSSQRQPSQAVITSGASSVARAPFPPLMGALRMAAPPHAAHCTRPPSHAEAAAAVMGAGSRPRRDAQSAEAAAAPSTSRGHRSVHSSFAVQSGAAQQ